MEGLVYMKLFYARKEIVRDGVIGVYEWECDKTAGAYNITEPHAWRKRVSMSEIGAPNASDAYGLTMEEAIGALLRGNQQEAESLEKKAAQYRKFVESAKVVPRRIGDGI